MTGGALWSTVRAEWTKAASLRSTVGTAVAIGLALPALAVLVGATGSLQPDDTIVGASLLGGAVLAQLLAIVLGTMLVTGEERSGLLGVTFAACPDRGRVLAAKVAVVAAAVTLAAVPGALAATAVGHALLSGDGYRSGSVPSSVAGVVLTLVASGALGVAIGALVRQPAGAVAAAVGVVLLPGFLAPLLGGLERWVAGASPQGVLQKLSQSSDATHDAVGSLGAWPTLGILALSIVGLALAGTRVLRLRDV